jgi:hypothetical protein
MKKHAAPIVAAVLLLLPVLYVGSFYAMVGKRRNSQYAWIVHDDGAFSPRYAPYRFWPRTCEFVFAPLEAMDRRMRPELWDKTNRKYLKPGTSHFPCQSPARVRQPHLIAQHRS